MRPLYIFDRGLLSAYFLTPFPLSAQPVVWLDDVESVVRGELGLTGFSIQRTRFIKIVS